jgi:hypothetical protein
MSLLEFLIGHCLDSLHRLLIYDLLLAFVTEALYGNQALRKGLKGTSIPHVSVTYHVSMCHQVQVYLMVVEGSELAEEPRVTRDVNILHDVVAGDISPGAVVPLIISVCIIFLHLLLFIIFTPVQLGVQKRVAIVNELVIPPLTVFFRRYNRAFLIHCRPTFAILSLILLYRLIHGYLMICKVL